MKKRQMVPEQLDIYMQKNECRYGTYNFQKINSRDNGVSQMVEHLPSKYKASVQSPVLLPRKINLEGCGRCFSGFNHQHYQKKNP
jgi:hypothetical protein